MTDDDRLRSRLRALDGVGPSSGLLERARQSGPRPPAAGQSVSRRLIVIVTAFAVFGASALLVWRAFDPTGTHETLRSTFGQQHQPPDWVVRAAIQTATNNQDPNPTSAYWILADSGIVSAVVDPSAATGGARGQAYLIVLYGSFTDRNARGLGAPPTGSVIAFALDPQSHVVTDFGLTSQPVHLAGLQAFSLGAPTTSIGGVRLLATSSGPNGNQALITGRLDSTGGCLSVNGEILLWPRGYGLAEREGAVWILDDSGTAVAKMGDPLHLGGSATDLPVANRLVPGGVPAACSAVQAATPDPYWLVGQVGGSPSSSPTSVAPPVPGLSGSLVIAVGPEGSSELFSYDLASGSTTDLGPGRDPAVSPDGTQIAFRTGNAYRPGGLPTQVGFMQIDGSHAHIINVPASVGFEPLGAGAATWSPDGGRTAFAAGAGIYIYDGQGVTRLTQYPGTQGCYDLEPSWAPDGSSLVFAVRCDGGNLGIWSVDINGANRHQLAAPSPGGVIDYRYPSWSPDGATLLFEGVAKDHGYTYDSYVMDRSGTVTRLTHTSCERPVWVSSQWIACPAVGGVELVRATGSDRTALAPFPGQSVSSVSWAPSPS